MVVIGYGGVARAIALGGLMEGMEVTITGRQDRFARGLAEEMGCAWSSGGDVAWDDADIIANGTTVHDHLPVSTMTFHSPMIVFDAIYEPSETTLLEMAREAGAHVLNGSGMFLHQAAMQIKIFLDEDVEAFGLAQYITD